MNKNTAPASSALTIDPDERHVEEVHCSECNVPIPALPNWYATIKVKFTCDACRQKSSRASTAAAAALAEAKTQTGLSASGEDADLEAAIDDPDADGELEIEDADTEAEAEAAEEE